MLNLSHEPAGWLKCSKTRLEDACRERRLKVCGNKLDLAQRIVHSNLGAPEPAETPQTADSKKRARCASKVVRGPP